jgi:2-polyprenyl-3-methyl-5-hydroxy-6-metoxy-1,4-benzoquinol methylase
MKTEHIERNVRLRSRLDDPDEPLEMLGFAIARYKFACKWLRATDTLLEVGSGEGFGCNFLARHVAAVTGIDCDAEAVARATTMYRRDNLQFRVADIVQPPPPPPRFDAVVALEMIEHVSQSDGAAMVANCAKYLRAGGLLILSTPRARPDRSVSRAVHHLFEYDYDTLLATLNPHFERVMIFCQNDEYIYAGHPSTAWNFIALGFR